MKTAPSDTGGQTVARLAALAEPAGQALLGELAETIGPARITADLTLRLGSAFRARYPADLVAEALTQLELRERAAERFSRAASMYFTRAGLEQSSAEVISRYRAARFAGYDRIADLCCGIGGDLIGLASADGVAEVLAVDLDPVHLWMAGHNAATYGLAERARMVRADVREADLRGIGAAFVDPARRSDAGRMRLGTSEPPLSWCIELADRLPVAVKTAPGVDRHDIPPGWELEFVAIDRELKETTAWSPAFAESASGASARGEPAPGESAPGEPGSGGSALPGPGIAEPGRTPSHAASPVGRTRATILPAGHTLLPSPGDPVEVRAPGPYLLDPNPAVTRAGLVEELARATGCWKIDERIAFLAADTAVRTPFARTLQVIDSRPWEQKRLPRLLRELGVGAVDIRRRGLAGNVETLAASLRRALPHGGRRATLVMTRVDDRPWGLVCVDPEA